MSLTPLPVHAVDASPAYLAALTGANILLFDRDSGNLRAALAARIDAAAPVARDAPEAAWAAFPRLCALSPSGHLLAVASDDKTLRVWRTDSVAYGREVLVQRLAKRAGTLQWVRCAAGEEVVVADKFGDVYSFVVDESNAPVNAAALPDAAADTDDPADAAIQPRLGHVSMVTCVAFLGDGVQPESIVTCDRDEHIRISRWGVRRAAHIVQQYVLGSRSFVGAIVVVPAAVAQRAGIDGDVLISSDGGACLRVWRRADGEYKLHRVAALDAARLANSVAVDAAVERRREKVAGNVTFTGVFDPSEPEREAKRPRRNESAPAESAASTVVVIQQLRLFRAADRDWLLLTIEGATALFVVPLDALAAAGTKADEAPVDMRAVDVGAPVLDAALVQGEEPTVYVCCDVRPGMGSGAPVRQFTWRGELFARDSAVAASGPLAELTVDDAPPLHVDGAKLPKTAALMAVAHTPRAVGMYAANTLSKLCLYSQVMTWPKPPPSADGMPFLGQRPEEVARTMVQRFQSGKRAAGRAKNQASIQQQFGQEPTSHLEAQP